MLAYLLACQESLGIESRFISDAQISASSQYTSNHAAMQARLHYKAKQGGWSAGVNNKTHIDSRGSVAEFFYPSLASQGRVKKFCHRTPHCLCV